MTYQPTTQKKVAYTLPPPTPYQRGFSEPETPGDYTHNTAYRNAISPNDLIVRSSSSPTTTNLSPADIFGPEISQRAVEKPGPGRGAGASEELRRKVMLMMRRVRGVARRWRDRRGIRGSGSGEWRLRGGMLGM